MYTQSPKRGRTLKEQIIDKFLLVYLIADVREGVGDTKLQKLAYLSELNMILQGRKGFNYNFIRMRWGPFSPDLEKDTKDLVNCGAITGFAHALAPRGRKVLEMFEHLLEPNKHIFNKIREVNKIYAQMSRDELVNYVHSMPNPIRPSISIDNTRHGSYILKRQRMAFTDRTFQIEESDIASLEIFLDPTNLGSLISSLKEAKTKPSVKLADVFDFV
jgi:uncharacterized protein YwgA